jgi:hypothetical protein
MTLFLREDLGTFLEENHTCPALANILLDTLCSEIHGRTPAFQHRHGVADPRFRDLIQGQTNIGWSQLFQDRSVRNWAILQDDFLATHNASLKLDRRCWTGATWVRKLISLLWLAVRAQWASRNADRHGRTKAANHAIRHARLLTSITALHAEAPLMLAADRDILAAPLPASPQHPTRLELWAQRTRVIVNRSKNDATTAIHRSHEHLTHCFRCRHKTKTANPAQPSAHQLPSTAQQPNETDQERPGPI